MNTTEWYLDFLKQRRLDRPDGRPLYEYRCTKDEYSSLEEVTRGALNQGHVGRSHKSDALFCLFAAEWWRRYYESGPWKWEDILDAVGISGIPFSNLYTTVEHGLRLWQREILMVGENRGFLVTLACEGGLPLNVIRKQGAKLRRFFKALLRDVSLYNVAGIPAVRLASQLSDYLPMSLRQEQVFILAGRLIESVWSLQQQVPTGQSPIKTLDLLVPNWRDRMPLLLEDETARAFLNGLITDAAEIAQAAPTALRLQRQLILTDECWRLEAELSLPGMIREFELQALFDSKDHLLGDRFELYILTDTGNAYPIAWATRRYHENENIYLLERAVRSSVVLQDQEAAGEVRLRANYGSEQIESQPIRGADALQDLPWFFVQKKGTTDSIHYLGQGAVKTKYPMVFAAITPGMEIIGSDTSSLQPVRESGVIGRSIYQLEGRYVINDAEGNVCRLNTKSDIEQQDEFRLIGNVRYYGKNGEAVYAGKPRLYSIGTVGNYQEIPNTKIDWRPAARGVKWHPFTGSCYGNGLIRYMEDGELHYRGTVSILPQHLTVRYGRESSHDAGELILDGVEGADVGIETQAYETTVTKSQSGHDIRIKVKTRTSVPSSLCFMLRWNEGSSVWLELPFPARGARFYGANGELLQNSQFVPVDRLSGIEARAISPTNTDHYYISGTLVANDLDSDVIHALWLQAPLNEIRHTKGCYRLDLRSQKQAILSLLYSSSDLDAFVRLRIEGGGGGRCPEIRVARYDLFLKAYPDQLMVSLDESGQARLDVDELSRLSIEMFPLWNPYAEPIFLDPILSEGEPTGAWRVSDACSAEPGPCMVIGHDADWYRVRPTIMIIDADDDTDEMTTGDGGIPDDIALESAVRIQDYRKREKALQKVVNRLATDPSDKEWDTVFRYISMLKGIPPSAIDLFRVLDKSEEAAVLTILKGDPAEIGYRLHLFDRLPANWYLVSIKSWLRATRRFKQSLQAQFNSLDEPDKYITMVIDSILSGIPTDHPYLNVLAELLRRKVVGYFQNAKFLPMASSQPGREALKASLRQARQELLQIHANNDAWPQASAVLEWRGNLSNNVLDLSNYWIGTEPGTGFRLSVQNAPVVAAAVSALDLRASKRLAFEIRSIKAFDSQWFDHAYVSVLALVLGELLENKKEYLDIL